MCSIFFPFRFERLEPWVKVSETNSITCTPIPRTILCELIVILGQGRPLAACQDPIQTFSDFYRRQSGSLGQMLSTETKYLLFSSLYFCPQDLNKYALKLMHKKSILIRTCTCFALFNLNNYTVSVIENDNTCSSFLFRGGMAAAMHLKAHKNCALEYCWIRTLFWKSYLMLRWHLLFEDMSLHLSSCSFQIVCWGRPHCYLWSMFQPGLVSFQWARSTHAIVAGSKGSLRRSIVARAKTTSNSTANKCAWF